MKNMNASRSKKNIAMGAAFGLSCVLIVGCASTPKAPTEALQAAELAIATAEQARVADYASPELGQARDKLVEARTAVAEKDMERAMQLAEKSRADAELAIAKADAAKAQEVNDELNKNINTLQQELQRNKGENL